MPLTLENFREASQASGTNALELSAKQPTGLKGSGIWSRICNWLEIGTRQNRDVMRAFFTAIEREMGKSFAGKAKTILGEGREMSGKPLTGYVVRQTLTRLEHEGVDIPQRNQEAFAKWRDAAPPAPGMQSWLKQKLPPGVVLSAQDRAWILNDIRALAEQEGVWLTDDAMQEMAGRAWDDILRGLTPRTMARLDESAPRSLGALTSEQVAHLRPLLLFSPIQVDAWHWDAMMYPQDEDGITHRDKPMKLLAEKLLEHINAGDVSRERARVMLDALRLPGVRFELDGTQTGDVELQERYTELEDVLVSLIASGAAEEDLPAPVPAEDTAASTSGSGALGEDLPAPAPEEGTPVSLAAAGVAGKDLPAPALAEDTAASTSGSGALGKDLPAPVPEEDTAASASKSGVVEKGSTEQERMAALDTACREGLGSLTPGEVSRLRPLLIASKIDLSRDSESFLSQITAVAQYLPLLMGRHKGVKIGSIIFLLYESLFNPLSGKKPALGKETYAIALRAALILHGISEKQARTLLDILNSPDAEAGWPPIEASVRAEEWEVIRGIRRVLQDELAAMITDAKKTEASRVMFNVMRSWRLSRAEMTEIIACAGTVVRPAKDLERGLGFLYRFLPRLRQAQPDGAPFTPETVWKVAFNTAPDPDVTTGNLAVKLGQTLEAEGIITL